MNKIMNRIKEFLFALLVGIIVFVCAALVSYCIVYLYEIGILLYIAVVCFSIGSLYFIGKTVISLYNITRGKNE